MRKKAFFSLNIINAILFCLTFIIKFFTDVLLVAHGKGGILVTSKYGTLILGIIVSLMIADKNKKNGKKMVFNRQLIMILEVVLAFLVISLFECLFHGDFTSQTIVELAYILLAVFYAYGILNSMSFETILRCMKILLVFAIIAYVLEIGTGNFTIQNILRSNYFDSYSPFESSYSASASMTFCTFFSYYRKEKKWTVLSLIFCIATFKRLNILFSIVLFFYPLFFNPNSYVKKYVINSSKLLFVILTIVFYYLYQPSASFYFERIFKDTTTHFTMGRNLLLSNLIDGGFKSFGYGSSTVFLGRSLEIDLIKILLEVTIIGLIIFICRYFDIVSTNAFCFLIMIENMLNFLTSHSLSSAFNWSLRFIMIGCILYQCRTIYSGPLFFKNTEYQYIGKNDLIINKKTKKIRIRFK